MLRRLWQRWKKIAHVIGDFQARVLLTVIYAAIVLPFGVIFRAFADSLRIKRPPTHWLDYPHDSADPDWARRQS